MPIQVDKVAFSEIRSLRELLRAEAGCQVVRDSILARGLADPFLITEGSATLGYAGVWTQHFPGRMMEFFVSEEHRDRASECFATALDSTGAVAAEAQTNLPLQYRLLLDHVSTPIVESLLFGEGPAVASTRRDLLFRRRSEDDAGPEGDWVVECDGRVIGAGGLLHHYNPPYADLFMEVIPEARGRGAGTFLVQELCRVCRETERIPAARCDPQNEASCRTLLRGGLVEIGAIVAGAVVGPNGGTV